MAWVLVAVEVGIRNKEVAGGDMVLRISSKCRTHHHQISDNRLINHGIAPI